MIAGIFLAAGRGARFGSNKLLHEIDGKPIVCHGLQAAVDSQLPRIYTVLGNQRLEMKQTIGEYFPRHPKITIVDNPGFKGGLMSSLKSGLQGLDDQFEAAMVMLADMPFITAGAIDDLIRAFETRPGIVMPVHEGTYYHPRIIPRPLFGAFLELDDDGSGVEVIGRFADRVVAVPVKDLSMYRDIDTPSELA